MLVRCRHRAVREECNLAVVVEKTHANQAIVRDALSEPGGRKIAEEHAPLGEYFAGFYHEGFAFRADGPNRDIRSAFHRP